MRPFLFASIFLLQIATISCNHSPHPRGALRGFYYWKTNFILSDTLRQSLVNLKVEHLYVKYFDVTWDASLHQPVPVALFDKKDSFPDGIKVSPVVFITLEALWNTSLDELPDLALKIGDLLKKLTGEDEEQLSGEIQVDCDWTSQTRDKYFALLKALKKHPIFQSKTLSVTIRLHQAKYINENGIPPADRGLLMCYNMGNLRDPAAKNSIIDPATFKSYTGRLKDYPIPLDIALPLFNWWVWFRNGQYYGLVHSGNLPDELANGKVTDFPEPTIINGYHFLAGDRLRHENSPVASINRITESLPLLFKSGKTKVILFHLDSASISNYSLHELEDIYHRFD